MKDIEMGLFDYAYSPVDNNSNETQRIINPVIKQKIKIFGKRIIKEEKITDINKIYRTKK